MDADPSNTTIFPLFMSSFGTREIGFIAAMLVLLTFGVGLFFLNRLGIGFTMR